MQVTGGHRINPELRELVVEASVALARLDADRLEELALSCRALNRDPAGMSGDERAEWRRQTLDASREVEVFGRVLDATRVNAEILNRVRERKRERLEYPAGRDTGWAPLTQTERRDGND
jgi:hypothetical protein